MNKQKIYIAGTNSSQGWIDSFLERMQSCKEIAPKFEVINIGITANFDVAADPDKYNVENMARALSKVVSETKNIGVILCASGFGADMYSQNYKNLRPGALASNPHIAKNNVKALRTNGQANVLVVSTDIYGQGLVHHYVRDFAFTDYGISGVKLARKIKVKTHRRDPIRRKLWDQYSGFMYNFVNKKDFEK